MSTPYLEVVQFVNGKWSQNCYLVASGSDVVIIDPGSRAEDIAAQIDRNQWRVHGILNTHAHYDHVGAVAFLKERYGVPFYLHSADRQLLQRANLYRMLFESNEAVKIPVMDFDISALPPTFDVGPFSVSWIATPGHTAGSVCLLIENHLFSGDTLMHGVMGRTDLPGGDRHTLLGSVRKLMKYPGETVLCGGHGPQSTLSAEFTPGTKLWSLLQ